MDMEHCSHAWDELKQCGRGHKEAKLTRVNTKFMGTENKSPELELRRKMNLDTSEREEASILMPLTACIELLYSHRGGVSCVSYLPYLRQAAHCQDRP